MMLDKIDKSRIWHQRYGHLYFNAMKLLYKAYGSRITIGIIPRSSLCRMYFWKAT